MALFAAVLALAAAPLALSADVGLGAVGAFDNDSDEEEYDHDEDHEEDDEGNDDGCELDYVVGEVTAWICDGEEVEDDDDKCVLRAEYFVIDDEVFVEFGPWWYWSVGSPNVTSIVDVGDEVNVTGVIEHDGDMTIISAWTIENLTTGQKLTIKEEGAPSWAGGPKAFGIDPWPSH